MRHEVINTGTAPVTPQLYLQLVRDGNKLPGESSFYSTFTGPAVYTEAKKYHKVEFRISKGQGRHREGVDQRLRGDGAALLRQRLDTADGIKRELFVRKVDANLYAVGMIAPLDA